jgi:hypothetical protein
MFDLSLFLGIILAFIKRNPIEIAEAIKNFHTEFISIELIQHLIQYLPNETEVIRFRRNKMSHIHIMTYKSNVIS